MNRLVRALVLTLAFAAPALCHPWAAAGVTTPGLVRPLSVRVIGVNHNGRQSHGYRFSTQTVRDLVVQVRWNLPLASHNQRLELFAPDGSLYQSFVTDITPRVGVTTVETRVLVDGTWITLHSLYGHWEAVVYLDGQRAPAATVGFILTE